MIFLLHYDFNHLIRFFIIIIHINSKSGYIFYIFYICHLIILMSFNNIHTTSVFRSTIFLTVFAAHLPPFFPGTFSWFNLLAISLNDNFWPFHLCIFLMICCSFSSLINRLFFTLNPKGICPGGICFSGGASALTNFSSLLSNSPRENWRFLPW